MPSRNNREYYMRRAQDELDLGDAASDARVSAIHYELAARYSLFVAEQPDGLLRMTLIHGGASQLAA